MSVRRSTSARRGELAERLRLLAEQCEMAARKLQAASPGVGPRRRRLREIYPWVAEAGRTLIMAWREGELPDDRGIVAGLAHVFDERAKAYHVFVRAAQRWLPDHSDFQWDRSQPWSVICCDAMLAFARLLEGTPPLKAHGQSSLGLDRVPHAE